MLCCEKCGHMLSKQAYPTKQCPVCGEMMRDVNESQIPASQANGMPPAQQPNQGPIPGQAVPQKPKKNKTKWIAAVVAVIALVLLIFQLTGKNDGQKEMAGPGSTGTTAARPTGSSTAKPTSTAHTHNWVSLRNVNGNQCATCGELRLAIPSNPQSIDTGLGHTVGLKTDGTVVAVGMNVAGQCNVENWTKIVSIVAGDDYTVGLRADGTVVAVGNNREGRCNVSEWTNIVSVSVGNGYTVALKVDGTVVAVGDNKYGQCDVEIWTNIIAIAAGGTHTVGLKADGTVVAVGDNREGLCDVEIWTNIIAIAAGETHTVGLKADGTVVAVGGNFEGQCDVENWTNIVAIAAGRYHTVALKADGTVVADGYKGDCQCAVSSWTNIVAIAAGYYQTIGLKADGTAVAVGDNTYGQCNVEEWEDIWTPNGGPAHHHTWKAATCTAPKTCSGCGATSGAVAGHDWIYDTDYVWCMGCYEGYFYADLSPQYTAVTIRVGETFQMNLVDQSGNALPSFLQEQVQWYTYSTYDYVRIQGNQVTALIPGNVVVWAELNGHTYPCIVSVVDDSKNNNKTVYKVRVVDLGENPVEGAYVSIVSDDKMFTPVATNEDGYALFYLEEMDGYRAKILTEVDGYLYFPDEWWSFEDGSKEVIIYLIPD